MMGGSPGASSRPFSVSLSEKDITNHSHTVSSEALSGQPLTIDHSDLQDAVYFLFPPQANILRLDA